jgi:hypothetical protein
MHYFELPKLPEKITKENRLQLWLALFKAKTEEELKQIEELEVEEMGEAIQAYKHITVTPEFKETERFRWADPLLKPPPLNFARGLIGLCN